MTRRQPLFLTNAELPHLIGQSEKIREVCRRIGQVAPTDATVLIQGESGTGKELVAHAIHFHSRRSCGPFIKVNCAALPETLIESELFGHVRGAFTGAARDRKGRFAEAEGGSILLDEIGSLSLASQAKLLRVLQEKEFEPVGSSATVKVDVRVIASCNHDLARAARAGVFREDLYYRLNVFSIALPPLRERREDVPLLAEHFFQKYAQLTNHDLCCISPEALQAMVDYDWPGNVRELENAIEHALIVETTNAIQLSSLPLPLNGCAARKNENLEFLALRERLRLCEKQTIQDALAHSHGVKKKAAELLGIHPKNLSHLLRKHGL
ncbi:MAG: sigma-54 dependent transcriptional regulator [candidate division KSB1 bacterium]|nr:sigma-54 dependent transcriptional regulator [candidate division KSB1 bacterium]MDZ7366270.1 sigma-54 dependent transcriptional regulator [candidate division KSB1 bacterium]MDZ7404488.1 sigma-54 dependent transcriptional regulator [candidate division KSB1 bacterium]